ncbi:MAG TPA: SPOR domain-containing protein [Bacteroidetes bacterium]|nr:SPOR domain-containing protein [Bacteroidota bacterium]
MIKYFILLVNMLGVLLVNLFSGSNVSLEMRVPQEVNAGSEFDIEVVLQKTGLESFARFQQELPRGLTAQVVDNPNASFVFEEQKVKFIWLRLPQDNEMKISYRVRVDERLKGNFTIDGLFSYIDGNERKSVSTSSKQVSIVPSTRIDPSLIVDISEFQQMIPVQAPVSLRASNVRCVRQSPVFSGEGNDMTVNLLVSRGPADKFAKIEEEIPEGYTAEPLETRDAIFTFKDQKAKFLWMNLPPEQRFVVNYRLLPNNAQTETELPLKGTFSFILNEATQVIDIVQKDIDLTNLDPKYLESILSSIPAKQLSPVGKQDGQPISASYSGYEGGKEIPVAYKKIVDKPIAGGKPIELDLSYQLEPEEGVYYRVQIAAGHKPVDIKRYFKRLSITEDVRTERHEGWYKYSIGSFYEYKMARNRRNEIWSTTPIDDAFVAAYNNGIRITVQEALMITNQQWYK